MRKSFPSTTHLTLFPPKFIYSPARPAESRKHHRHNHHHVLVRNSSNRVGGGEKASPLVWAKNKQTSMEMAEPTSPKVTCVGQVKVRHKARGACKSWQSVMEEIEIINKRRQYKKKSNGVASLGFKKDAMQFLTCLRNVRFDFRCFGSVAQRNVIIADEENDDGYISHGGVSDDGNETISSSKWIMVLQENQTDEFRNEKAKENNKDQFSTGNPAAPSVPPSNALLLMRCRSAPTKSWLEEKQEEEMVENGKKTEVKKKKNLKALMEEEKSTKAEDKKRNNLKALIEEEKINMKKERMAITRYKSECYRVSTETAKETWVVGGMRNPLSRSKSCKR